MNAAATFWRHVAALTLKETRQVLRDRSAILLGVVMPLMLVLLFGYGMSFDVQDVRLGIVDTSGMAQGSLITSSMRHNRSIVPTVFRSRVEGMEALASTDVEALLVLEERGGALSWQVLVDGINAPRATSVSSAVLGVAQTALAANGTVTGGVSAVSRIWFNESAESRWYLVPGLFVVVLTLTGMVLTGLVIAKEWERGTMEAMIATPASPLAFLLSKTVPYFFLGMTGWALSLAAGLILYHVPMRGSATVILLSSALYLIVGLGIGLTVSGVTKSQFLSSQIMVLAGFMPAVILSGFIFDLRSAPVWADVVAHLLPPVYYLELLKVGFLTGGMEGLVAKNFAILAGYALFFLGLAYLQCQKRMRR